MSLYSFHIQMITRSKTNTVDALAYRSGSRVTCPLTGEIFDRTDKAVQHVELMLPEGAPSWAKELQALVAKDRLRGVQRFCDLAEGAEKRQDAQLYREFRLSLPREFSDEQSKALVREFIGDQACLNGMTALLNFHFDRDEETGETNPHCHVLLLTRRLSEHGLSDHKEREWNRKSHHESWREQWAAYGNFYLKMHGLEAAWDHRSYEERGIDLEPQPKLGSNVRKQEARLGQDPRDIERMAATATGGSFREVKLRNLYRIVSDPECVLRNISRMQATFMWGDVQAFLARYIDDPDLFMRMDLKLKASRELVRLRDVEDTLNPSLSDKTVYTTREKLKEERDLVSLAGSLDSVQSHGIKNGLLKKVLSRHDAVLSQEGFGGLSEDQKTAIRHMVSTGALKCLVGYAGAGKTTALKAAKELWEESGYRVYGLAPTGRAERNLEKEGIKSTTLHKFLKDYESGRAHYNPKTVLVLDEAGMVDLERGTAFLKAVENLGVKAVLVGDGAQLQPVEAGPFFRLVTGKVPASRLETIVRQKEDWQKEATTLFGQLKTEEALHLYQEKGYLRRIDAAVPDLKVLQEAGDTKGIVELYKVARGLSGRLYSQMKRELEEKYFLEESVQKDLPSHPDYGSYRKWQALRTEAVRVLTGDIEGYKTALGEAGITPLMLAKEGLDKSLSRESRQEAVRERINAWGSWHTKSVYRPPDLRQEARAALIEDWKTSFEESPQKSSLIMAHTNRDVRLLNEEVRHLLKEAGRLPKEDFTYRIERIEEQDFGKQVVKGEERSFARGDRLIFLRTRRDMQVRNGMLGTIESLDKNNVKVRLDEDGRLVSFAPKLYPYFDQGWALTIHKSQGTTVDKSYVLAASSMNRNVSYVVLTRHREEARLYASSLEFSREESLLKELSKAGDKLSAKDYLSAEELEKLVRQDETRLQNAMSRIGNHLEAIGCVSKRAWQEVTSKITGTKIQREEILAQASLTEESRSQLKETVKERIKAGILREAERHEPLMKEAQSALTFKTGQELAQAFTEAEHGLLKAATPEQSASSEEKMRVVLKSATPSLLGELRSTAPALAGEIVLQKELRGIEEQEKRSFSALKGQKSSPHKGIEPTPREMSSERRTKAPASRESKEEGREGSSLSKAEGYNRSSVLDHLDEATTYRLFADRVASHIPEALTRPDGTRSGDFVRWGEKGGFAVNLKDKYFMNFYTHEKGDIFKFIAQTDGIPYKEAIRYVAERVSAPKTSLAQERETHRDANSILEAKSRLQAAFFKDAAFSRAQTEWMIKASVPLQGTLAERYLREHRKIEGLLPQDLYFFKGKVHAGSRRDDVCLMAVARGEDGKILSHQMTFLNPHTGAKSETHTVKKLTQGKGVSAKSFVEVQKGTGITFIAEGLETALSIKEAGVTGEIRAGFGRFVFANSRPHNNHIVLVADYDGTGAPTHDALSKDKALLEAKGYKVDLLWPTQKGEQKTDFNDILRHHGKDEIKRLIQEQIPAATFAAEERVSDADLARPDRSTDAKAQETQSPHEDSQKSGLKDDLLNQNALAYFEREFERSSIKSILTDSLRAEVEKRVASDPLGAARWWYEEHGGMSFDFSKPETPSPSSLEQESQKHVRGGVFIKDFEKELIRLDKDIQFLEGRPSAKETCTKFMERRNELLSNAPDHLLTLLKEHRPELAARVEAHREQQQQTQQRQRSQGLSL